MADAIRSAAEALIVWMTRNGGAEHSAPAEYWALREALAKQPAQGDKVPGYFQTGVLTTPAKPAQGEAVCSGCNGRGEVGGWAGDSYQTDPCPFCAAPPEPKP